MIAYVGEFIFTQFSATEKAITQSDKLEDRKIPQVVIWT